MSPDQHDPQKEELEKTKKKKQQNKQTENALCNILHVNPCYDVGFVLQCHH